MSKIVSVSSLAAPYRYRQKEIFEYMSQKIAWSGEEERKSRFLYERSAIHNRHSVLQDFSTTSERALYINGHAPSVQSRMACFTQKATPLATAVANQCIENRIGKDRITHLITVSCTGISAPGLDIQLVKSLGLAPTIERSSVNFMGCYAALHAIKQAYYIAETKPDACVLIVSVELCTLHFQQTKDEDTTTANMLFADGAAAVLVTSNSFEEAGFMIKDFHSDLLLNGEEEMSWNVTDVGFQMTLSSYVPKLISTDIAPHFEKLLERNHLRKQNIGFWALHPGGKAILEVVARQMELDHEQLGASYKILREFGNMSSATVLFVLKEIWDNTILRNNDKIIATAFGPGLTVESILLEYHA